MEKSPQNGDPSYERELQQSFRRLNEAQRLSRVGFWEWRIDRNQLIASEQMAEILGRRSQAEKLYLENYRGLVHPDDQTDFDAVFSFGSDTPRPASIIHRIVRPDGHERHIEAHTELLRDEMGKPQAIVGTSQDVTDRTIAYQRTQALLELSEASSDRDDHDLYELSLHWCERLTGSSISFLHFVNDDQESLQLVAWSKRTLAEFCHVEEFETHYPISSAGIWAEAFHKRQAVIVNDYATAEGKKGLPDGHAVVQRIISLPILEQDQVKILFGVGNKRGQYTNSDVKSLNLLADYIWRIISRKAAERKRRNAEAIARTMSTGLEQNPASIVITDALGTIEYVNPAFESITGYRAEEAIGQNPRILKSNATPPEFYREMWDTLARGQTWQGLLQNRKKSGEFFWEQATISPIVSAEGEIEHFLAIKEDVTEKREIESALQAEREITELQRQFISLVSHEFRTPLAVIDGSAQRILRRHDRISMEEICERMTEMRQTVVHLTDLMESVLSLSRLDAGKISIQAETMDLLALTTEVSVTLGHAFPEHVIGVDHDDGPHTTSADPKLIRIILSNLISNAAKYSDAGSRIDVRLRTDAGLLTLSVTDQGRGISESELPKVFSRFFRASNSTGIPGSGIGLYLSRQLAEMSHGTISVESTFGEGSVFTLRLPEHQEDRP